MTTPEVTLEYPYILFSFSNKGELSYEITNAWWGGIKGGFYTSDGFSGNSCEPKNLEKYIKYFTQRQVKNKEKEIKLLEKELKNIKKTFKNYL